MVQIKRKAGNHRLKSFRSNIWYYIPTQEKRNAALFTFLMGRNPYTDHELSRFSLRYKNLREFERKLLYNRWFSDTAQFDWYTHPKWMKYNKHLFDKYDMSFIRWTTMRQERRALLYCIFPFEGFYYSPAFTEKYEKYLSFHISQKELDEIKFHKGIMLSGLKSKNHYSSRYIHELLNRILYLPKTSKLTYRSAVKRTTLVDTES